MKLGFYDFQKHKKNDQDKKLFCDLRIKKL